MIISCGEERVNYSFIHVFPSFDVFIEDWDRKNNEDKCGKDVDKYNQGDVSNSLILDGKDNEKENNNTRQKRYTLEEKTFFIGYMVNREKEQFKPNLSLFAEYHDVSRTTLYKLRDYFVEEFSGDKPGPKGRDENEELARKLQEELRKRDEELAVLKAVLRGQEAAYGGQEKRIIRTILQACVCPISIRQIRDLIFEAFGVWISKSKIKMLIAEYSMKARQIMQEMGPEKLVEFFGADEVFCGSEP